MGQTYTRQSSFADGDTITAALFNNEYNQLVNAFSYSATNEATTGHRHDGSAGEGGNIPQIGDLDFLNKIVVDSTNNRWGFYVQVSTNTVEQIRLQDGVLLPVTDNDIDLGTSSLQFKDLYINGTANIDSLVLASGSTVTAVLDEDDLSSDSATSLVTQQSVKAYVDSQVTAQDLDFQGDTGGALSIDLDSESLTIAGGTGLDTVGSGNTITVNIDATVTTLTGSQILTNKTIDADNNTVSNIEVDNFKASAIVLESEGIGSNDNDTTLPTSAAVKDYVDTQITAEDLDITTDSGTIAIDLDSETLTVSGGTGLDSSATGNAVTLAIDSTVTTLTGSQTLTNKTLTSPDVNTPDIDGGTIDGATIATSDVTVGAGKTLDVSAGTITLADNQISGDKVEGGTIAATTITDLTFGSLNDGTITATAFVDEDNMASNSATLIPTQQSVKAYVDTTVAATNEVVEDTTPQLGGDLASNGNDILFADSDKAVFGTGSDLQIYHDGNNSIIDETGTGNLFIRGTNINLQNVDADPDENMITAVANGAVNLYYDNVNKLQTTSTGINVTGTVTATDLLIDTDVIVTDSTNDRVGINKTSPATTLDVGGSIHFSSVLRATGDGSESAPSIQPGNDGDTGFFRPTANTIGFSTGGSERMRIDSSGRLLVGTTSHFGTASAKLQAQGDGIAAAVFNRTNDGNVVTFKRAGGAGDVGSIAIVDSGNKIGFYGSAGSGAVIDSSGNVGISGVTSPAQAIDVSGNILSRGTSTEDRFIEIGTGRSGNGYAFLDFVGDATYTDYGLRIIRNNSGANTTSVIQHRGTGTLGLLTQEAAPIQFSTSNEERMRIDSSGSVGIGTAIFTNSYKTYIEGLDQDTANLTDSGNHGATLYLRATANSAGSGGAVAFGTTFGNKTPFAAIKGHVTDGATNTIGDLAFSTRASTSATALTERMRLTASGNVGIGITSLNEGKLHVKSDGAGEVELLTLENSTGTNGKTTLTFKTTSTDATKSAQIFAERVNASGHTDLAFRTYNGSTTERMRISSGGAIQSSAASGVSSVISRTTAPSGSQGLNITAGVVTTLPSTTPTFADNSSSGGTIYLGGNAVDQYGGNVSLIAYGSGANGNLITFSNRSSAGTTSERMRIDSSGVFMVAKTSASSNNVGFETSSTGNTAITRDGGQPLLLNRKTSDGDIILFKKSGISIGSIGVKGGDLTIGTGVVGLRFHDGTGSIRPITTVDGTITDDTIDLGTGVARFDDIYATNATIQTSDRNEKQDIEDLTDAETRVAVAAKGLLRKFKWKSAVASKGDNARIHFGIIAQDLQDAFTAEGLDAGNYGMFISTTWTDDDGVEQTRLGVRYSELLAFIIAAI
jgi:hypothetical protein